MELMLQSNGKMLFGLFFSEPNYAKIKGVYGNCNFIVIVNIFPSFSHTFGPIDVIKNNETVIVNIG
jgi:hypothetical protein